MIRVNNLSFSYHEGENIFSNINLEFDHRSTAIIGQNGAGKTTFVKLLKGLLKPTSGDIYILGQDAKNTTIAGLSKGIGLVFQNPNDQLFKSKVLDEVMFGPLNIGQDRKIARLNSLDALVMVGLENRLEENPQDLTLSEKKLLCIASILAMNTEVIIFDEPTIAQDHAGLEKIRRIIQTLKEQGKLILTIIHDMDFVAENFERTVVFNQGNVILDGNTRDVFSNRDILRQARLETPFITQLGEKMGYSQTFLTVDEFIDQRSKELF